MLWLIHLLYCIIIYLYFKKDLTKISKFYITYLGQFFQSSKKSIFQRKLTKFDISSVEKV